MILPDLVIHNQTQRFVLLAALYIKTQAKTVMVGDLGQIAMEKGFTKQEFDKIVDYLVKEGLISELVDGTYTRITHLGIKAVEGVFKDVNAPTTYFPSYTRLLKNLL
jgi:predicted transcriptional regulator